MPPTAPRPSGPVVSITSPDLQGVIDGVRQAEKELGKVQRTSNRKVAAKVAGWAQADAAHGSKRERRFAGAIKAAATVKTARLRISPAGRWAGAGPTFWGSKRRTGWYARARYKTSRGMQHPERVGNTWKAGERGQGPYVLNDTVAARKPEIGALYEAEYADVFDATFMRKG